MKERANEQILKQMDECGPVALERLTEYMRDRARNIEDCMRNLDTLDPYMLGYHRGLEVGLNIAVDLVSIAETRAFLGEPVMTDRSYFTKLGQSVDAVNSESGQR